ncbi:MAG: sulfatase-like hydrolase/transferase [Pirellulaceae bacterium]|nr:sulfatase-like hydrolase/transferase [Pirellulaceae bacterium]
MYELSAKKSFARRSALQVCLPLLLLLLAGVAGGQALGDERRPNVVVILADDQGWGDLSVHGNRNLSTPSIDSLARDGALIERFFVCPVCSPTRAEFFTGRYHPRGGVYSTSTGGERLDLDERTIGDFFQAAGYATGAFGKWHNGMQYPYHPRGRGFQEYYGFCSGHWGEYFNPPLEHNGRLVQGEGYITDDLTSRALDFIEQHRDQPFFCYLPYNTPHSPMQVPDRFYEKFAQAELAQRHDDPAQEDLAHTRAALAMCENIDWNVGRVLTKLDELQLAERTIVIYFSDNGPNGWRWNGGMKGRKGSTDEGGVRVPCLVRWRGRIPAGARIPEIAAAVDLLPTLAEFCNVSLAGGKPLDGVSLVPLLAGQQRDDWPDRMIFSHWAGRVSVRTQRYRLDAAGKLFDMRSDPEQRRDVSRQHSDETARLAQAVDRWKRELLPGLGQDDRPFPVGFGEFPATQLPARDGVPHGNVRRSARAPNCSFFENWTSRDDSITWDVQVEKAGRYEVVLHYTCPQPNVGVKLELALGDSRLACSVTEAHDPPLRGAAEDRVSRGPESYVKDFKPLPMGTIALERGRGQLTLRALEMPGPGAVDVRQLMLTLLP